MPDEKLEPRPRKSLYIDGSEACGLDDFKPEAGSCSFYLPAVSERLLSGRKWSVRMEDGSMVRVSPVDRYFAEGGWFVQAYFVPVI